MVHVAFHMNATHTAPTTEPTQTTLLTIEQCGESKSHFQPSVERRMKKVDTNIDKNNKHPVHSTMVCPRRFFQATLNST
jgi:hypothetical protein